jgi:glycosyltransferase involved in cell wall biosynthesis
MSDHPANGPLVSVYIPTANRKDMLKRAVKSVLAQSYRNIEIIIVDDASADGTEEMMRTWCEKEPRLRYIRLEKPSGANVARNRAILAARGEYVTGLDDDDEMLPERIAKLVDAYRPDLAFVTSRYFVQREGKRALKRLTMKRTIAKKDLLFTNIIGNQILTSREKFLEAGLFDETLDAAQDLDMWIRLLDRHRYARILTEPLLVVNLSGSGSITTSAKKRSGYWRFYTKHKHAMSPSHRKYRLLGMMLEKEKDPAKLLRFVPLAGGPYALIALGKWLQ